MKRLTNPNSTRTPSIRHAVDSISTGGGRCVSSAGMWITALGRLDGAIDDLTQVIALVPCGPMAYQERGEVYAMQGLVELAQKDFEKASALRGEFN